MINALQHAILLSLVALLSPTVLAQPDIGGAPDAISEKYAQELATQPLPQGFRAPDRSLPEYQSVQATFTVTTSADSGPGSLREAMDAANASPGLDAIAFDIGGGGTYEGIEVLSLLPYLTDPVTIDGDTQGCDTTEGLCIRLDGPTLVADPDHLRRGARRVRRGSTIHGLLFTRFYRGTGIPALQIRSADNTVTGCYFGTDRTGMITDPDGTPNSGDELGNGQGIIVANDPDLGSPAVNNTIGGATAAERNVVAGSTNTGILLLLRKRPATRYGATTSGRTRRGRQRSAMGSGSMSARVPRTPSRTTWSRAIGWTAYPLKSARPASSSPETSSAPT